MEQESDFSGVRGQKMWLDTGMDEMRDILVIYHHSFMFMVETKVKVAVAVGTIRTGEAGWYQTPDGNPSRFRYWFEVASKRDGRASKGMGRGKGSVGVGQGIKWRTKSSTDQTNKCRVFSLGMLRPGEGNT